MRACSIRAGSRTCARASGESQGAGQFFVEKRLQRPQRGAAMLVDLQEPQPLIQIVFPGHGPLQKQAAGRGDRIPV